MLHEHQTAFKARRTVESVRAFYTHGDGVVLRTFAVCTYEWREHSQTVDEDELGRTVDRLFTGGDWYATEKKDISVRKLFTNTVSAYKNFATRLLIDYWKEFSRKQKSTRWRNVFPAKQIPNVILNLAQTSWGGGGKKEIPADEARRLSMRFGASLNTPRVEIPTRVSQAIGGCFTGYWWGVRGLLVGGSRTVCGCFTGYWWVFHRLLVGGSRAIGGGFADCLRVINKINK